MSGPSDMDTADVLDAAADYLRTFGWRRGDIGGEGTPACVVGSVVEALRISPFGRSENADYMSCVEALASAVSLKGTFEIAAWNDEPSRTADEVITALMEAAARLRTGEVSP